MRVGGDDSWSPTVYDECLLPPGGGDEGGGEGGGAVCLGEGSSIGQFKLWCNKGCVYGDHCKQHCYAADTLPLAAWRIERHRLTHMHSAARQPTG
jgi:hypothetical protein